jgi:hypothetical protein
VLISPASPARVPIKWCTFRFPKLVHISVPVDNWRVAGAARGLGVSRALLSGQEPLQGQPEYVRAAAQAMLGGDEVAADEHREGEHAANLDLFLVDAESAE